MNETRSTFAISQRHGIWRVTLDGVFFGDCRSRELAREMAETAATALRSDRRLVNVVEAGLI